MATPYKMKGSPMKRNFGIGSPVKKDMNLSPELLKLKKERVAASNAGKIIKFGEGSNIIPDADDTVSKNFNTKGSKGTVGKTPGYSTTKAAKAAKKVGKVAKKVAGKAGKFLGGKALGVAGMLMATSSKADQPTKGKGKKEYEGGKIDFTKKK
tara:strand:+ start:282 stop:740 length:459 start_codon:yes stop_codon:yes gene_type:complete